MTVTTYTTSRGNTLRVTISRVEGDERKTGLELNGNLLLSGFWFTQERLDAIIEDSIARY